MEALFLRMLTLSAVCGVVLLPLLVLGRRIRHRYAARTMYVLWLLMAVRLILPFQFQLPTPMFTVEAPGYTFELPTAPAAPAAPVLSGGQGSGTGAHSLPAAPPDPAAVPSTASLTEILTAVWVAGAALFAAWQIVSYLLARRALLRASTPAEEGARAALDGLRSELGVRRAVELRVTAKTASPVMLGLFRPVVLLPAGEEVPALVLRHELCHLKRLDVAYKGLMLLANAVHWFNPVVWWMAREAGRNLELCCDEAALRGVPADGRRAYGEILLRTAGGGASPAFSTRFGSGKKQLKERLYNLFQQKRTGKALVCAVLVLALALGSLVACESGADKGLSPAHALAELEDSIVFDPETGNLTFVLPAGYTPASDWSIHVAGRMLMGDDGGMSLHYFEGEEWQPGNTYTIGFTKEQTAALTELTMDAALPDPEGQDGERSISVDLLAVVRAALPLSPETDPTEIDPTDIDRTDLEACIGDAILQSQSWHANDKLRTQAHVTLKVEENGAESTAYVMAMYLGFMGDKSGFEEFQGGNMPVAINFDKNEAGEYRLVEYWQPIDGEGYWDSIRERFPHDIPDKDLDTQTYVVKLIQECYAQAVAYWDVDTAPIIEGLLEEIAAAPGVTADPNTFPDGARKKLGYYSKFTLDYCMGEFEKGGQTGLKGTVMASICQEILGPQAGATSIDSGNGQQWYEAYKAQKDGHSAEKNLWPLEGQYQIAAHFDMESRNHNGCDIAAPAGVGVRAVAAGTVTEVGENSLLLTHDGGWQTGYAGLKDITVAVGDTVERGAALGAVWDTPEEPHGMTALHYEYIVDGQWLNPLDRENFSYMRSDGSVIIRGDLNAPQW